MKKNSLAALALAASCTTGGNDVPTATQTLTESLSDRVGSIVSAANIGPTNPIPTTCNSACHQPHRTATQRIAQGYRSLSPSQALAAAENTMAVRLGLGEQFISTVGAPNIAQLFHRADPTRIGVTDVLQARHNTGQMVTAVIEGRPVPGQPEFTDLGLRFLER